MLLPACKEDIAMVPAVEILICNAFVRSLIARGEEAKLTDVIQSGEQEGMQDMASAIAHLVKTDTVLQKVALELAPNRDRLNMVLRGISVGSGRIIA